MLFITIESSAKYPTSNMLLKLVVFKWIGDRNWEIKLTPWWPSKVLLRITVLRIEALSRPPVWKYLTYTSNLNLFVILTSGNPFDGSPSWLVGIKWNVFKTVISSKYNMFYMHVVFAFLNIPHSTNSVLSSGSLLRHSCSSKFKYSNTHIEGTCNFFYVFFEVQWLSLNARRWRIAWRLPLFSLQ